jgi:hypothetical protein
MQIPIIRFVRSGSALLTRDIIPEECVLVNYFFAFSANFFAASCGSTAACKFFIRVLDTHPHSEYSYSIVLLRVSGPEAQRKEGF